jgi:hypothetical protein
MIGGRGGIRTHGTLAGTPVFKTGALNHSATLPGVEIARLFVTARRTYRGLTTDLLPFVIAIVYGGSQRAVNRRCGLALHIRHQVAVDVHSDGDRGMAEPLLDDLGMDLGGQHVAGVAVPQLVQGDAPFLQKGRHNVRQASGLHRLAIHPSDYMPASSCDT